MKGLFRVIAIFSFCVLPCPNIWAEVSSEVPESPLPLASEVEAPKPVAPPSPAEIAKNKERQKKIDEKRIALEATQWSVSLVSNDQKVKPESDTFTFINGQFKSENRSKRGFLPTNYTVTIPDGDDPSATFETMQSGKDGRAFIKGVWKDGVMEGRITEQSSDAKKSVDYFFTNAKMAKMDDETKKVEMEKVTAATSSTTEKSMVSMETAKKESASETSAKLKDKPFSR